MAFLDCPQSAFPLFCLPPPMPLLVRFVVMTNGLLSHFPNQARANRGGRNEAGCLWSTCPAAEQRDCLSFRGPLPASWVCAGPCVQCGGERDAGPGFTQTCCVSLDNVLSGSQLSLREMEGQPRRIGVGLLAVGKSAGISQASTVHCPLVSIL